MMASNTPTTKVGDKVCLDIGVDLKTNRVEDEDDVEAAFKELLEFICRHERRFELNIASLLETNPSIESEPNVAFVGAKLKSTDHPA